MLFTDWIAGHLCTTGNCPRRWQTSCIRRCSPIIASGAILALGSLLVPQPAWADVVRLKGGGEVRGQVLDPPTPRKLGTQPVIIQTLSGAQISIAAADVEFLTRRSIAHEEHDWEARWAADTVESHWKLQEWCRDKGLRLEREEHLRAITRLEPMHDTAQKLLGNVFYNQRWMSRDDMMAAKGLVKYKGKYIFPQELEVIEASAVQREAERKWHKQIYLWRDWLTTGPAEKAQLAQQQLREVTDEHAIRPLQKLLRDVPQESVRMAYVETLARIGGSEASKALAVQSLHDVSPTIRSVALSGIAENDRALVAAIYTTALEDELNEVVLRAAVGLARWGDQHSISALITALNTSHLYQVKVAERRQIPGLVSAPLTQPAKPLPSQPITIPVSPLGASLGLPNITVPNTPPPALPPESIQLRTVTVRREHQNREVLAALKEMTQQDFGYDERTWKLWWAANNGTSSKLTLGKKS